MVHGDALLERRDPWFIFALARLGITADVHEATRASYVSGSNSRLK
jgi:hypothetical protein